MLFLFIILLLALLFTIGILLIVKIPFWLLAAILIILILRKRVK